MRPLPARWRGNGAESPVTKGEKARKTGPPGLPPRKKSRQGKKIGSHDEFLTSLLDLLYVDSDVKLKSSAKRTQVTLREYR